MFVVRRRPLVAVVIITAAKEEVRRCSIKSEKSLSAGLSFRRPQLVSTVKCFLKLTKSSVVAQGVISRKYFLATCKDVLSSRHPHLLLAIASSFPNRHETGINPPI